MVFFPILCISFMGQEMVLAKSQSKQGMPVSPLIPFPINVAKLLIFPKRAASLGHAAAKVKSTKKTIEVYFTCKPFSELSIFHMR